MKLCAKTGRTLYTGLFFCFNQIIISDLLHSDQLHLSRYIIVCTSNCLFSKSDPYLLWICTPGSLSDQGLDRQVSLNYPDLYLHHPVYLLFFVRRTISISKAGRPFSERHIQMNNYQEKFKFFSSKQYDTKVFVFSENYAPGKSRTIGLIYSRERMIAIDTGSGAVGDIRKYMEAVCARESFIGTPLAIMSVCTSGVPECVGGAGVFDEVFISEKDLEMAKECISAEHRLSVLKKQTGGNPVIMDYCQDMLVDNSGVNFMPYDHPDILRCPGDVDNFHLGGVHIEVIDIPGHTPGSIALSVKGNDTDHFIFTGESLCIDTTYLPRIGLNGLREYLEGLKKLIDQADADTKFFCSTSPMPFDISVARNVALAVEEIIKGQTDGDLPAEMIFHGEKSKDDLRLHFVNNNSVLYNASLLR